MDEIIERLARECADGLAELRASDPADPSPTYFLWVAGHLLVNGNLKWDMEEQAEKYRGPIADAVAAALRRLRDLMNAGPLPSPVSVARLAEMAAGDRQFGEILPTDHSLIRQRRDLLAHVEHLERLVRLLAQESEGLAFAAGLAEGKRLGRAEGAAEQRKACAAAALTATQPTVADWDHARRVIARAAASAPLVTDAEAAIPPSESPPAPA